MKRREEVGMYLAKPNPKASIEHSNIYNNIGCFQ